LHLTIRDAHVGVDLAHGRQGGVEGVEHALWVASCARCKGHAVDLVGTHVHTLGGCERLAFGDALLQVPFAIGAGACHHHVLQPRNGVSQLPRHAQVVEALEGGGADEGATAREAQDVVELAYAKVRIDLVGDCPDQFQREEDDRKCDAVWQLDGDYVPTPDADAM
jgi:hypothetical protein